MSQRYSWIDAAMVRVATGCDGLELAPWPDLNGNGQVDRWRAWLARVWAHEPVAEAIEVASPALARQVEQLRAGREVGQRQVRRMVLSVAKYVLRMTGRATPFGLFAGVAPLQFGTDLTIRWGDDHRATARPDAVWLSSVVVRLEECPQVLRRLTVVANNLCFVRDDRLVVPCRPQPANGAGSGAPAEVSLRHTKPVETVVRAARVPVRVAELAGRLAADRPATPPAVIEEMLAELVRRGALVTCLHAPMTVTEPLGHVLEQLTAVGAEAITEVAPVVRQLRTVHDDLSRHNRTMSARVRRGRRTATAERMSGISSAVERPLVVDLRLDCGIVLPQQVAREAETAASLLARLTPYPSGSAAWGDYHRRFVDRYGTGALVPVRDLVDGDTGLGYPAGYRDSTREPPAWGLSERDLQLLVLAQTAAMAGDREVTLDEAAVTGLETEPEPPVAPHTDLCFQVHAPTRQAVERGEFDLVVVGAARAAGTLTGRFLHLLDPADRDRMIGAYSRLPTLDPDAIPAQVSFPPLYARTGNVARAPAVRPRVISLAEHPTGGEEIPLDDLAVGADTGRLYLMSLSRRRPVEPTIFQAVEFRNHVHPLARLLCEITTGRAAACTPFLWEAASRLPFLPRLRHGRIVLAAARWRLRATDLPDRRAPWPRWESAVSDWSDRFGVPDRVYLGEGDQRLRLERDEPMHLALLRAHLDRNGHATLYEAPDLDAFGWLDGRPHEIVIPLAATHQPGKPGAPRPRWAARVVGRGHGHLPGVSPWLSAKLYGHPNRMGTILIDHLPRLLSTWQEDHPVQWWFLRYRDPDTHLRLRLKVPGGYGWAAEQLGTWAAELRRRGLASHLVLDTYHPEIGRYGTGEVMTAAETVFAADSEAAVAQLAMTAEGAPHPKALCAASFVDLVTAFTGGIATGLRWLVDEVRRQPTPALPRDLHNEAIRLANPYDDRAGLRAFPGGGKVAAAWARRRAALAGYRTQLVATGQCDPTPVIASLLHVHHARIVGVEPDSEKTCHRLARAAALSWTNRTAGATR